MADINNWGFLPVNEVMNIFSESLKNIEEDYKRQGVPDLKLILEHIDNIRLQLIKRSKFNIESYLKNNPESRKLLHQNKKEDYQPEPTSRSVVSRVELQKMQQRADALKG